jgi:hypothetical protein
LIALSLLSAGGSFPMKKTFTVCALAALAGGAVLTVAPAARAQVDCTMAANVPHPVYIAGSTASKAYLEAIAPLIPSITLIYAANLPSGSPAGSCQGVGDIITPSQTEVSSEFEQITTAGGLVQCTAGANAYAPGGIYVDIGVTDVYPETCITPGIPSLPAGYALWDGAVQAMEIAVPYGSSEFSISADAAYVVFGYAGQSYMGATYAISPWTVPTDIWTRGDLSGTQLMISAAIGLSGDKWLTALSGTAAAAQVAGSGGAMTTDLETSAGLMTGPDPVIGILSNTNVDPNKNATGVRGLAFQGKGQDCGYYPDSTKDLLDKINVRQGRYEIWGYEHFVTNVSGGNVVANPNAAMNPVPSASADVQTVIDILTHKASVVSVSSTPSLQAVINAETSAYYIPQCAMQVGRTTEDGPEMSVQPSPGCGCFYENQPHGGNGNLSSYCTICTVATDCTDKNYPVCNFGYCEAM